MSYSGYFRPKNPNKYKGDPTNIIYRSSWELKLMLYLDAHPDIVKWASEEFCIPYRSPVDNKIHRYFPDMWAKKTNGEVYLIEVKPLYQVEKPKKEGKSKKKYLNEVLTYGVNQEKWKMAREYCADRGWEFIVLTEKELNIKW